MIATIDALGNKTSYSYDKEGNITIIKDPLALVDQANRHQVNFTYDERDNQTSFLDANGNLTFFNYDQMNNLATSTTSQTTTYYHYDGFNVIAESNQEGQITSQYFYDNKNQLIAMKKDNQMYYYQFNAHGDIVSLTDSSGTVVNEYKYDPWGNLLAERERVFNPYRYAGYMWDKQSGLYDLKSRYYSPEIYRFLTKDKRQGDTRAPLSLNFYLYVNDNPVNFIDPTGEDWKSIALSSISLAAGIAATVALFTSAPAITVISLTGIGLTASLAGLYLSYSDFQAGQLVRCRT